MIVHYKRRTPAQVQVPLTSLIDMVFLLLIYFMLTTNYMVEEGISVNLPKAKAAAPRNKEVITVTVNEDGIFFIGKKEIKDSLLFDTLKGMLDNNDQKLVVVKADRSVVLDKAVRVFDLAKAAGAKRLSLATEKEF